MSCSSAPAISRSRRAPYCSATHGRDLDDLEDVLEQAAPIGVMDLPRRRPDAQPSACRRRRCARAARAAAGRSTDCDAVLQLAPHLVDRPRRRPDAVFFAKPARGVVGNDAADLVEHQLELLVERVAAALHGDELAGVELLVGGVDVAENLGAESRPRCPGARSRGTGRLRPLRRSFRAQRKNPVPFEAATRSAIFGMRAMSAGHRGVAQVYSGADRPTRPSPEWTRGAHVISRSCAITWACAAAVLAEGSRPVVS